MHVSVVITDTVLLLLVRDKPVANTALQEWGGKLWALWEADRPMSLDPTTLETLGEEDLRETLINPILANTHFHRHASSSLMPL